MSRCGQQINEIRLEINRHVPRRLSCIDNEWHTMLARDPANLADGLHSAGHIAAWVIAISLVSGRMALRISLGSTSPVLESTGTRV